MNKQNKASPVQSHLPYDSLSFGKEQGKLYQNKEWLYQKYWNEKLNLIEIGKICGVSDATIRERMIFYNVPRRSHSESTKLGRNKWIKDDFIGTKIYHNRKLLEELYLGAKLNTVEIAEICGTQSNVIIRWLRKHEIPIRNRSKANKMCGERRRKRIKKYCLYCGKEFELRPCEVNKRIVLCSWRCRTKYRIGKNAPRPKQQYESKCEQCNKIFYVHKYKKERKDLGRFCSQKCMIKRRANIWIGKDNPNFKNARKTYICKNCGKKYIEFKRNEKKTNFCSRQCVGSWVMKNNFSMGQKKMTAPEKCIDKITGDKVRYVGLKDFWLKLDGKNKNPDFKVIGQRKIIEVFGDYWHRNDDPSELIYQYGQIGYQCLVIWEYEIKNSLEEVKEKIENFISIWEKPEEYFIDF